MPRHKDKNTDQRRRQHHHTRLDPRRAHREQMTNVRLAHPHRAERTGLAPLKEGEQGVE